MVEDVTGKDGVVYFPYIMTLFMFIVVANFLGLLPTGVHHHQSHCGDSCYGSGGFPRGDRSGVCEKWFWLSERVLDFICSALCARPILALIEVISYFVRPVSHSIRLAGNMMAGHAVIKVFAAFAPLVLISTGIGLVVTPLSILAITAIYALEVLVSFIQAYVFRNSDLCVFARCAASAPLSSELSTLSILNVIKETMK